MNPQDYCRDKAAPAGSSLHYALLFAAPGARPGLLAISALHAEISTVVDDCNEPGVAAVKLNWWHEELERVRTGQPRHPVGKAVAATLAKHELDPSLLDELLGGARMDLEYGSYPTFRELSLYCHRVGMTPAQLAVQICGYQEPSSLTLAHDLGLGLQLVRVLRRLPRHLQQGRVYLPEEDMQRAGVTREQLLAGTDSPELRTLFAQQAERAHQFLTNAEAAPAASDRASLRPLLVTAALYRRLLETMQKDGLPLLDRRYHLTPLRKLGIAWRTARRHR